MAEQGIFYTLEVPEPGEDEHVYGIALRVLNNHFTQQVNTTFERSLFRSMTQHFNDTVRNV